MANSINVRLDALEARVAEQDEIISDLLELAGVTDDDINDANEAPELGDTETVPAPKGKGK